jgi:hypothetical protein
MAKLPLLSLCVLASAFLNPAQYHAQQAASQTRITNPIDESSLVTLKGTVHPLANARNDRGAAPDGMQLNRLQLVLKRSPSQESALHHLIDQMHTPGQTNYHKWLTPDQFGAQFGPTDQDIATVSDWLASHGFIVTRVNPGRQTMEIAGNVAQMRSAFHTRIHQYSVNGETHYANADDPRIPSALAPVVGGFFSLNNFRYKSNARIMGKAQYNPHTGTARPEWTIGPGAPAYDNNYVLSPADYAVQYDLQPLYNNNVNGSGQSIAIVNESNVNIYLVNQFRSVFGLPFNPPQVIIDGSDPGVDGINNFDGPNGASVEAYLDVEWAGAIAPDATVYLVIAADSELENGLDLAMAHAVDSNIAPVISLSFGNCEAHANDASLNSLWEQAAAQGITVIVSTGDSGSAGCDDPDTQSYATGGQAVNGLASTPYNVAVGGTDFYYSNYNSTQTLLDAQLAGYWDTTPSNSTPKISIQGVIPEQPWNNSQYGLDIFRSANSTNSTISAGSGGASNCATRNGANCLRGYPKPAWQSIGIKGMPFDEVRDLPDVSLFAANGYNDSYYPICAAGGDCQPVQSGDSIQITGVGGTSASAPSFAGIMALVNQKYGRQGQADYVLYPLYAQFPSAFNDVTVGTNTVPCEFLPTVGTDCISAGAAAITVNFSGGSVTEGQIGSGTTPEYNAAPGYDLATGLGTIDANHLVTNWPKVAFQSTTTTMTASPTAIAHGAANAIAISGTVTGTGTPTGDVALVTDSPQELQQGEAFFTLRNGAYSSTSAAGKASYPSGINFLPGGTYHIWGQYGGDTNNALSSSDPIEITVTPEASAIDLNLIGAGSIYNPGNNPGTGVDYGTQLQLSAAVGPASQAAALQTCLVNDTGCSSIPSYTSPTGTVAFSDNSKALYTAALNADGEAEYNAPYAVGAHSLTASYAGDNSYSASTDSSPVTFTVIKDTPTFGSSPFSITTGGSGTNTYLINGTGQPTVLTIVLYNGAQYNSSSYSVAPVAPPTGTVAISGLSGATPASATLVPTLDPSSYSIGSIATFQVPAGKASGMYNVTFTYSGDSNYNGTSKSGTISITGDNGDGLKSSTTTANISGSISPDSRLLISGTVAGSGTASPTGTVDFYSSGYVLAEVALSTSAGSTAQFSASFNSNGLIQGSSQIITVQYSGDSTYNPSAAVLSTGVSNPLSDFTMVPQTTNIPIGLSGTTGTGTTPINIASVNGFTGTVTLSCSATSPLTCTAAPNPTLSNNSSASAAIAVTVPSGTASGTYNALVTGKDPTGEYIHTLAFLVEVTGAASATPGFGLSNGGAVTVTPGATTGNTTSITATATGGFTGEVALTCAVAPASGTSVPTCTVTNPIDVTGASAAGILTIGTTATTTAQAYTVTVTGTSGSITESTTVGLTVTPLAGSGSFTVSNGGSIVVTQGATTSNTTPITVTPTNGFTGDVALTCAVTPTTGTSIPTCSVTTPLDITGATAASATLTINTTSTTTTNTYTVAVTGTSGSLTSTTPVTVIVTPASASAFALTSSGNITVSPGATTGNTSTISVTPSGGFTGNVALTCSISPTAASDPATCSLSPATADITASAAVTSTLTASTTAASSALNAPRKIFWPATGGTALALAFFFLPKRRRGWLAMLGVIVMFAALAGLSACGGGIGGGGGGQSNLGTTAGNYTVTITGTSGSLTTTTSVTLTVN